MPTPNPRISRANETRDAVPVRRERWKPSSMHGVFGFLANNPNWSFKWVNTSVQKETDLCDRAYMQKVEDGWSLVNPSDLNLPDSAKRFVKDGVIQRPGQVLMKIPREIAQEITEYYMAEDRKKRNVSLRELAIKGATDEQGTGFANVNEEVARTSYVGEQTANI